MHEAGIAQQLIAALEERLAGVPHGAVREVHLRLGELTGVCPDALDFAFTCLARDTALAGARLVFARVPLTIGCDACGHVGAVRDLVFRCGRCGSERTRIVTGRELEVRSVTTADEAEDAAEDRTPCTTST